MSTGTAPAEAFPRFRPSGDAAVLVEFGDEMELTHSFRALTGKRRIEAERLPGVVEVTQGLTSLLVQFDPGECTARAVLDGVAGVLAEDEEGEDVVTSRLIEIPVHYDDPWTHACIDDYRRRIGEVGDNLEAVAAASGLPDAAAVVREHARPQYWVAGLGTWPGLPFNFPMDPGYRLRAPKYNPARTWTPEGSIGLGGQCTSIYSIESPGGYQLLGRTPVPIWRTEGYRPWSHEGPALFRAGDRVKFVPVPREEYDHVSAEVDEGRYQVSVLTYERFSIRDFVSWAAGRIPAEVSR